MGMIGVIASPDEHPWVREFFELFKTPWEFFQAGRPYDVVISTRGEFRDSPARVVLLYGSESTLFDKSCGVHGNACPPRGRLRFESGCVPIYGRSLTFEGRAALELIDERNGLPAAVEVSLGDKTIVRVGYDLFWEVRHVLTAGQPSDQASIPALEWHIVLLREWIVRRGLPLVEIPPVPNGHRFMACLTHDVDHPVLRRHFCDHTMLGFLYRATVGSLVSACRGKIPARRVPLNWLAVASLPLVYLGLVKDIWRQFHRYAEMEAGLGSTFFVVPFKGRPGQDVQGGTPVKRATRYDVEDILPELEKLASLGCEVGVHGIEAWRDVALGRAELERVSARTGAKRMGVRMHWLFFDEHSPVVLEQAGFVYDSTVGYNETVGYRAGTTQVYRPPGTKTLLELPLHVMDTALFYPDYLDLSLEEAQRRVWPMLDEAVRLGGVLTFNWHDRSILPERLWGDFYSSLVDELKQRRAWFPTAGQAVQWFEKRRRVSLQVDSLAGGQVHVKAEGVAVDGLPGLVVRLHRPRSQGEATVDRFVDVPLERDLEVTLAC